MNYFSSEEKTLTCLTNCKTHEYVIIQKIDAGKNAINNLSKMGISIGDTVKIKTKSPIKGPIIISHNGTDIAVGNGLAQKIFVEKV